MGHVSRENDQIRIKAIRVDKVGTTRDDVRHGISHKHIDSEWLTKLVKVTEI